MADDTQLRCMTCGTERQVAFVDAVVEEWPKCCEQTMRLVGVHPDVIDKAVETVVGVAMDYTMRRLLGVVGPGARAIIVLGEDESPAEAAERFTREAAKGPGDGA